MVPLGGCKCSLDLGLCHGRPERAAYVQHTCTGYSASMFLDACPEVPAPETEHTHPEYTKRSSASVVDVFTPQNRYGSFSISRHVPAPTGSTHPECPRVLSAGLE
jgi:hypothetical protein